MGLIMGADPEATLLSAAWDVVDEADCDFMPSDGINKLLVRGANPSPVPIADAQHRVKLATVWNLMVVLSRCRGLIVEL